MSMNIDEAVKLLNQVGLPVGLVLIILWFIGRNIWPFFVKQLEEAQKRHEESEKRFMEALVRVDEKIVSRLEQIANKLNGLEKD